MADESTHVATITEAARADSTLPARPRGIGPDRVQLRVMDDSGIAYPLIPEDSLGHYRLSLSPRRGGTYRLAGEIDASPVTAETRLPLDFVINRPGGDTISISDGTTTLATLRVPYDFTAPGATAFECRVVSQTGAVVVAGGGLGARGELVFLRDPETRAVLFLAYNQDAAEWLARTTPRGNVAGAFGEFGGALVVRRLLVAR